MILHIGLSTLQGKPRSMRDGQLKSTFRFTIRQSLRLPVTPATNTKGNDMANWIWNVMDWASNKAPKLEALRAENVTLNKACDVFLEGVNRLKVQITELQAANDELISENKSNHNVGVEYRDSAQRLSVQVEDLQRQVATRNMDIVALKNRVKRLEDAITQAVNAIDSE
jgi:hypothetical protein